MTVTDKILFTAAWLGTFSGLAFIFAGEVPLSWNPRLISYTAFAVATTAVLSVFVTVIVKIWS